MSNNDLDSRLRGLWPHRERLTCFSENVALSRRSAMGGKAGVGPFQSSSSTFAKRGRSVRSVAMSRNRKARSRWLLKTAERLFELVTFTCQSHALAGMASSLPKRERMADADFVPHPG